MRPEALDSLEKSIWSADNLQLQELEGKVAHRLQLDPYDLDGFYLMSRIKLRQFNLNPRDFDSTLRLATELGSHLIAIAPQDEKGYIIHSEALDSSGRNAEALAELAVLPSKGIHFSWRYYLGLARLSAETQPIEDVLDYLKKSLEFPNSNRDLIVPFAIACLDSAVSEVDSMQILKNWNSAHPHPLFDLRLAEALLEENDFSEARKLFREISHKHPDLIEATINYAILEYEIFDHFIEAEKSLNSALSRLKNDSEYTSLIYNHLGRVAIAQKKPDEGAALLWKSILKSQHSEETITDISTWLKQGQKWNTRINLISQVLDWGLVRATLYGDLGESYYQLKNQSRKAIESFEHAMLMDSKNADYYNALGLSHNQNGDPKKALQVFAQGLKTFGNHAEMLYNAACIQSQLGSIQESWALLKKAVGLSPELFKLAQSDPDLENLKIQTTSEWKAWVQKDIRTDLAH